MFNRLLNLVIIHTSTCIAEQCIRRQERPAMSRLSRMSLGPLDLSFLLSVLNLVNLSQKGETKGQFNELSKQHDPKQREATWQQVEKQFHQLNDM